MSGTPWSTDELARLRQLAGEGLGWRDVAARIGRPNHAVRTMAWRLGVANLRRTAWTPENDAKLAEGVAAGMARKALAAHMGCTVDALSKRMRHLGLKITAEARDAAFREALETRRDQPGPKRGRKMSEAHREAIRQGNLRRYANMAPEDRAALHARLAAARSAPNRGKAVSDAKLAHIPAPYRPLYRQLVDKKGICKAEATRMVLEQARREEARAVAARNGARQSAAPAIIPFEEQLRRLAEGRARLVPNMPVSRPATYVASELAGAMT